MAREAVKVSEKVVVVLGARFEEHREILTPLPVKIVHHPLWENGMGSSIKAGMKFIDSQPPSDAVIVMACDQPLLKATHLQSLVDFGEGVDKLIVASTYAGTSGIPVLFKRPAYSYLRELDDSAGARKIIQKNGELVSTVAFPGGETDLDTPEDLAAFLQ